METLQFLEGKRFASAEEELAFLKEHIAKQESRLDPETAQPVKEHITTETLEAYKRANAEDVLDSIHRMPAHDVERLVLHLKPEAHDKKMEELFGLLIEKGIKNTLAIVSELSDPHVEDDFHRFLVQYLHSMQGVPGLKENTPLWKGLDMALFEISLPEQLGVEKKGFKDFIQAMEQFYAGMMSIGDTRENSKQKYFTLEIALSNDGSDVRFYAGVPRAKIDLFEKQVLGFYHDAKIEEVTDDYNVFTDNGGHAGSFAYLSELELRPLKTSENIDHDPMNAIVNAFSKLKGRGEGAAVQFVIVPEGDGLNKTYSEVIWKMKNEKIKAKQALSEVTSFTRATGKALKQLIFGVKVKDDKEVHEKEIELITNKIKAPIVRTAIRIIASAENSDRAEAIRDEIEATFNQFEESNSNAIVWHHVSKKQTTDFFYDFSFRQLRDEETIAVNLKELSALFHFPIGVSANPALKQAKAAIAPAPSEIVDDGKGVLLGVNEYRGTEKKVYMSREDRVRHFYVIGQTGTGKTTILKNMIIQDIKNGDGVCFIDPHGSDLADILANIPPERIDDVIYFDPAYTARPMGLNMLEYDPKYPEQKTFVVNELLAIFNKLFDMKVAGGPAFEQYFRNSALLVMEDPESGMTLLEIGRVLADKAFRDLKLSRCKNPIIKQFWENAEKTTGEQSLANFVPYITNKFDVFISNDIMRPVVSQEKSVFNFREIMDNKKILLVNLSKGRLGDINANLIGLVLVGKITMAALSRVDILGKGQVNDFYLYIDEFQNVTTDSIATILSEARKYRLSLNIAHQYIEQLEENIKNAVFGNVGSMAVYRVSPENAEVFAKQFEPVFTPSDIIKLENFNAYLKILVKGVPVKPFNIRAFPPPKGNPEIVDELKELSYLKFGRPRDEVESEILARYKGVQ